jgi:phosphate-selective porin OprO/OprP
MTMNATLRIGASTAALLMIGSAALAQESKDGTLTASFKDGIRVTSADGDFDLLIGAYLGLHYRFIADRPQDNVRTSANSFFVRQARPELSGTIYKDFDYRLLLDFPTGGTSVAGTVQDAYAGWRYWPWLSFRAGQFKEPFGQEQTWPDRILDFNERSDVDRFVPARDLGFMVYGRIEDGLFSYEAGVFNGQGRAVVDQTDNKELAVRLRTMPFAQSDEDLLKRLRLGVAGTVGTVDSVDPNALDFTSMSLAILALDATAGELDGPRTRLGAELAWHAGPFSLHAEWVRRTDTVDVGAVDHEEIVSEGEAVALTWLLTGEDKPFEAKFNPDRPFNPRTGGWGAVELAVRVDYISIDDDVFRFGIADPASSSNRLTAFGLGVNWYLNRNIRLSPNFIMERYEDEIQFSDGRREDRFYGGILRLQVEF